MNLQRLLKEQFTLIEKRWKINLKKISSH
jgi:hypothetical protein